MVVLVLEICERACAREVGVDRPDLIATRDVAVAIDVIARDVADDDVLSVHRRDLNARPGVIPDMIGFDQVAWSSDTDADIVPGRVVGGNAVCLPGRADACTGGNAVASAVGAARVIQDFAVVDRFYAVVVVSRNGAAGD